MNNGILIKIDNIKAYYKIQSFETVKNVKAVDGITMDIRENEIIGIAGESGSGKSTLGRVLYGYIESPLFLIDGKISYFLNNEEVNLSNESYELQKMINLRWKLISYIPQSSMNVLNPTRKIYKILEDIIESHNMDKNTYKDKFFGSLESFGLNPDIVNQYSYQLSGGMRQRIVIALATIFDPKVIIADEPTSALDVVTQWNLILLFKKIHRETKNSFVFITHDMSIMANLADRVAIMYGGKLLEIGMTRDIFENPQHPYTKFLINSIPQIGDKSEKSAIPGFAPDLVSPPPGCRFLPRCPYAKKICEEKEPSYIEVEKDHKVSCFLLQ
jgi:peptide/nickel transport system ATP-binding protein